MKGYKGFNADMTCRGMQYEIGKTYQMDEPPELCKRGYHFCETLPQCFKFYDPEEGAVFCEVEASGEIVSDNTKSATNKLSILKAVEARVVFKTLYGDGNGYGYGYGDGDGYGYGDGDGNGDGNGNGNGDGYGYGDGDGYAYCNSTNIQKILIYKED